MKRFWILLVVVLTATAALATYRSTLVEPDCCKGKECFHVYGEDKHHICNKYCHDSRQMSGHCCGRTY